jgi:hypothetical protein
MAQSRVKISFEIIKILRLMILEAQNSHFCKNYSVFDNCSLYLKNNPKKEF